MLSDLTTKPSLLIQRQKSFVLFRRYVDHIETAYDFASRKLLDLLITEKKLMARLRLVVS